MAEHLLHITPKQLIFDRCSVLFLENTNITDLQKYKLRGMLKKNLIDAYNRSEETERLNSPTYKAINPEERLRGFAQVALALGDSKTSLEIYSVKNQIKLDAILYPSYEESTIPGMINLIKYPTNRFGVVLSEYAYENFLFHKVLAQNGELGLNLIDPMERIRANGISLSTISWNCAKDSYKIFELLSSMTWCGLGETLLSNTG